jgi:TPR repeat protein
VGGLNGAASMYIRGEGLVAPNVTAAVERYERAANEFNSGTALNGLGYAYHQGQGGLIQNQTKAFEYFLRAATLNQDSDSLTNAAHCYSLGAGVDENQEMAGKALLPFFFFFFFFFLLISHLTFHFYSSLPFLPF